MSERIVAVVGAGIVGLAHAWAAAKRGHQVHVFERTASPQGASIRNFGMVWPIGQPFGPAHDLALWSRGLWQEVAEESGIWLNPCGSLHVAHHDDEMSVLEEFAAASRQSNCPRQLLTADQVTQRSPAVRRENLRGGLWSETEMGVNPPAAIQGLARWLATWSNIHFHWSTAIQHVTPLSYGLVELVDQRGEKYHVQRVDICSGADLQNLFPELLQSAAMRLCKLHMMRTVSQPSQWRIGPHLASGLTLRHYSSFANCPTLPQLQKRIAEQEPRLDQYGIHVMASQNEHGEIILGDSHEYDAQIEPFDKVEIDELILQELHKIFDFPNWKIGQRWHGIYAKLTGQLFWSAQPFPNCHLVTGLGGNGMTLSLAVAESRWATQAT